jgi:hypothetical protein
MLLDWSTPWRWLRDLRDWISVIMGFLHETTHSRDNAEEYERVVDEIITQCTNLTILANSGESKIRGYSEKPAIPSSQLSAEAPLLPLSQGEYDEPIGLPLVVVCQNVCLHTSLIEQRLIKWTFWNEKWDIKKNYLILSNNTSERFCSNVYSMKYMTYFRRCIIALFVAGSSSITFISSFPIISV